MENVHKLYRPKPCWPKGCISSTQHQPIVDGVAGHRILSFLDVYSGYNHIKMDLEDKYETTFITLIKKLFLQSHATLIEKHWSHILATDGKDILLAGREEFRGICRWHGHQIQWLVNTHQGSRGSVCSTPKIQHEVKPWKVCLWDRGKFLGLMITHKGIDANLDKCQDIFEMRSHMNLEEAQWLASCITSLFRFLPRIAKKVKPVMNLLKKNFF